MFGFLVRGCVRIEFKITVRVGVMFNISINHWSKYCTKSCPELTKSPELDFTLVMH